MKLVIASNNAKKRREIEAILAGLDIDVVPAAATRFVDVDEDADSFAGNARKKAEAFADANQLPALADDSGLCVDALAGAPGVYSSRFAGPEADDAANNAKLLRELADKGERTAHFCCALHIAFPDRHADITAWGQVDGHILSEPSGQGGFGYDPLFFSPELGKCFAEASHEEKSSVSHRGRALRELAARLAAIV